jgi:hypothetical protein
LGERTLCLRQLDGHAELFAEPANPGAASAILARVLVEANGAPVVLDDLLESWRDRALAGLFEREFGSTVDARAHCTACGEPFAFGFAIGPIIAAQTARAAATGVALDAEGFWVLGEGRLRPPTLGDVLRSDAPDTLLTALSEGAIDAERADALLDAAAPLLSIDLETACPHCLARQTVAFSIGAYFVECLAAERPLLIRETHLIASRYGWSHESIMALPRGDRRAYAHLVVAERSAAQLRRTG